MAGPIDRNDQSKIKQMHQRGVNAVQQAMATFVQDFAAGRAKVTDRFGRGVTVGDLIMWTPPNALVYEVVKIEPILSVSGPGDHIGKIQVSVELTAPVIFLAGQPAMSVVVVGKTIAPGQAELYRIAGGRKDNGPAEGAGDLDQALAPADPVDENAPGDPALDDDHDKDH